MDDFFDSVGDAERAARSFIDQDWSKNRTAVKSAAHVKSARQRRNTKSLWYAFTDLNIPIMRGVEAASKFEALRKIEKQLRDDYRLTPYLQSWLDHGKRIRQGETGNPVPADKFGIAKSAGPRKASPTTVALALKSFVPELTTSQIETLIDPRKLAQVKAVDPAQFNIADIAVGEPVKAVGMSGDGRFMEVGAYGLRFGPGNGEEKDITGDWFAADTDYGPYGGDGMVATFHHCQPVGKERAMKALSKKVFRPVKATRDDIGIFVRHVLDMADEYEKAIGDLVKSGKLRWSSGTASHLVDRENKSGKIKRWHILEWAYTPQAAEPRLPTIMPLKSYPVPAGIGVGLANAKTWLMRSPTEFVDKQLGWRVYESGGKWYRVGLRDKMSDKTYGPFASKDKAITMRPFDPAKDSSTGKACAPKRKRPRKAVGFAEWTKDPAGRGSKIHYEEDVPPYRKVERIEVFNSSGGGDAFALMDRYGRIIKQPFSSSDAAVRWAISNPGAKSSRTKEDATKPF